jgi:hypothetical protein
MSISGNNEVLQVKRSSKSNLLKPTRPPLEWHAETGQNTETPKKHSFLPVFGGRTWSEMGARGGDRARTFKDVYDDCSELSSNIFCKDQQITIKMRYSSCANSITSGIMPMWYEMTVFQNLTPSHENVGPV